MSAARLLRRLSGRPDDLPGDLQRLLAIRRGATPARPDLGLPDLPAWLPDASARRALHEAVAATLRAGEPRLADVAVQDAGGDPPRFAVRARRGDGAVGASLEVG